MNPVYFFAGSSPFVKYAVDLNQKDEKLVSYLIENPLDDNFKEEDIEQDPLDNLEKYQTKIKNENDLKTMSQFTEAHAAMPLKKYIRRWSNWVIDLHWLFTLKYFMESLPSAKLYYFIKNYPILDNFILHWMWWSYSLNKDIEIFTKDAFRAIGSMPWLVNDVKKLAEKTKKLNNRKAKKQRQTPSKKKAQAHNLDKEKNSARKDETHLIPKQPSKFFQYNEMTMKTIDSILFQNENDNLKKFEQLINAETKFHNIKNSNLNSKKSNRSNSSNDVTIIDPELNKHGMNYFFKVLIFRLLNSHFNGW